MAKSKDSVVLYESFFEATAELEPVAIAEIWRAIHIYLNGEEPQFTDASARLAWRFIVLQLNADQKKWQQTCELRRNAGRVGGLKSASIKQANQANASFASSFQANEANATFASSFQANEANATFASPIEANQADTDTESDTDKKKEREKKEKGADAPAFAQNDFSVDDFVRAARDPSVAVPEDEARKCFDFYAAQGFVRGNGRPITQLAPLLRHWKAKAGEFAVRTGGGGGSYGEPDIYTIQRAFEWYFGHFWHDDRTDPKTEEELKQWARENGIYERLKNRNDAMYRHVYKTGRS